MLLVRRFLVLVALMFWLGGFTFYAGVVVPVGQNVLGGSAQADVTRQVSIYLNLSCAIALLPLGWDIVSANDPSRGRRVSRRLCWYNILAGLLALYWLHGQLAAMLDEPGVGSGAYFSFWHRAYLWLSTYQWAAGVIRRAEETLVGKACGKTEAVELK